MRRAKETGAFVCCINYMERKRLIAEYDLDPIKVLTPQEVIRGSLRGRKGVEGQGDGVHPVLYMDNLDMVLTNLLGYHVEFATVTGEATDVNKGFKAWLRRLWKKVTR